MVGRVIGKGGETIKSMQREFQSNIQIDQSQLPMKITISGQPAAVERTFQVVSEIVQGGNPYIGGTVGHAGGLQALLPDLDWRVSWMRASLHCRLGAS